MDTIFNRLKFILAIYQIVAMIYNSAGTCSAQNVSAFFVFGDSMVEAGNNYHIYTLAKPAYPYEEELGFKDYSPPFLDPNTTGDVILKGVNYASAASGILNSTGYIYGQHIGMSKQVDNFAKTRQEIISRIGEAAAKKLLKQAFYFILTGSNDFSMSPFSPANYYIGSNFVDEVISQFRSQLTMLYNLDARKFAVTNLPAFGCTPIARDLFLSDGCVNFINKQVQTYNTKLKSLLQELTANLPGSTFDLKMEILLAVDCWGGMVVYMCAKPTPISVKIEANMFSMINPIQQILLIYNSKEDDGW
ncbi:Lipase, GDSL [Corchorus olitorius]|uniref:Lipase, GDSL n=1 Tax=Corchorus olitorius TaxID=93759 RepID=A0A1R3H6E8_9ROSI|nr:Lipase, GDSL [Corchorus olitorius]